jgi:flagellar biosynthesis GTPase FlhF
MILKNIFGKTIDAAKKTARQMYGDDFLVIESSEGDGAGKKAQITIFSDGKKPSSQKEPPTQNQPEPAPEKGVMFERTSSESAIPSNEQAKQNKLDSLRKFAEKQELGNGHLNGIKNGQINGTFAGTDVAVEEKEEEIKDVDKEKASGLIYSRSLVRPLKKSFSPEEKPEAPKEKTNSESPKKAETSGNSFITHFKPSKAKTKTEAPAQQGISARHNEREIKALHKRFDKLEALLDSALISANLDYASHPAFQQLVQTGINTSIIAGWFSQIIEKGIDPYDQTDLFMAKLGGIVRNALGEAPAKESQKFMLFAGPSGAGKTSLIMKLTQHPDFFFDKKIAVVSVYPQNETDDYYTILEPFCTSRDIPYFKVQSNLDVTMAVDDLKEFDHVFIDTPSLDIEQNNSFRDFWKIRQLLSPLAPLEVHYVVNAAMNRFYFRDSSATHHPLQPDYVAITHLDEVTKWGPVIPFLQQMGCSAKYLSLGNNLSHSLNEFNPQWFAQKVLQEN